MTRREVLRLAAASAAWPRPMRAQPSAPDVRALAEDAYLFAYPLVLMEFTRRDFIRQTPLNTFRHSPQFPPPQFHAVVRPNVDTLYSSAWLDLSAEPVVMRVPDTAGRYYLMQFMDAWTETFSVPGKRTTGTGDGWFAIVGPGWTGKLPAGVQRIDSPTNTVWLIGRIQTNTAADYQKVHAIQRGFSMMPLSRYPDGPARPTPVDPSPAPTAPPPARVAELSALEFFRQFRQLLKQNPPHAADAAFMRRLDGLDFEALDAVRLKALEEGVRAAQAQLSTRPSSGRNGWQSFGSSIGRYGTDYKARARVARTGLGANPPEDAVYLSASVDADGQPLSGANSYRLHFDARNLPPVKAFWSLTLYDPEGFFAPNSINRYALGDRDPLAFNSDGSLDIYLQQSTADRNWLPTPNGPFNLTLRLYWPNPDILEGRWTPPPVTLVVK